jgi:hypothetical protein
MPTERKHKMIDSISTLTAREHMRDLRHDAERWRMSRAVRSSSTETVAQAPTYALRLARPDEAPVVGQIAELDDAPALDGQVLVALLDGTPIAALSLRDRRVVATPFVSTSQAVALLKLRAEQLLGPGERQGWRARLRSPARLSSKTI